MSRYSYRSRRYSRYDSYFPPAPSKGERLHDAAQKCEALRQKGVEIEPVVLEGFKIAKTFWGKAWCDNVESYRDYAYRLERGRSYVRSNSVIDLQIKAGGVAAQVMGSSLYKVNISIQPVASDHWRNIRQTCAGRIGSLIELLRGQLSNEVMAIMTERGGGLFPTPKEIKFKCSCPDVAGMCKHIAATMYGIGNRLDTRPELLFLLRGVDTSDLLDAATGAASPEGTAAPGETLAAAELADVFGVDIDTAPIEIPTLAPATRAPAAVTVKTEKERPRKRVLGTKAAPVAEKRPRGRPPKSAVEAAPPAGKRPRGRPPKSAVAAAPSAEKRPRGRPPKSVVEAAPPPEKRPRGRPRKSVVEAAPPPEKRPRGRPRKNPVAS